MQKKILALAVAGLVSGGAFAQSNVTIYGVVDVYYGYAMDNVTANTKNTMGIGSGGQSGSRFGFKGSEDLGNGLKANFKMEGGFNADVGTSTQTGVMGRWSTVSLAGAWGEVQGGRRDTFQDELLGAQDANGRTTVAQVSPVYADQARIGNFVAYLSPVWNGLQFKAGYSSQGADSAQQDNVLTQITNATQNVATNSNLQVYTAAVHYVNGPVLLGAAYDYNKLSSRDSNVAGSSGDYSSGSVWNIAGAYDFGVVRINGAYGMINYANNQQLTTPEWRDSRTQWSLGASAPVGASGKVTLTYAHAKIDYLNSALTDPKMDIWGVAYFHSLSKRTNVYAGYGQINQDDASKFAKTSDMASVSGMADTTSTHGYQKGIQVGLRHLF